MIQTHYKYSGQQRTKNASWNIGDLVNVGFIKGLKVLSIQAVKDGKPDIYTLEGKNGAKYEYTPYNGLYRIN